MFELKPGAAADRYAYLPPGYELRCVPVAPVFQCDNCRGLTGSLMSQISDHSSSLCHHVSDSANLSGFLRFKFHSVLPSFTLCYRVG
jgi:hypothetical protein